MRTRSALGLLAVAAAVPATFAIATARRIPLRDLPPQFERIGLMLRETKPGGPTAAYLSASRIAAVGEGALAIDADSGALLHLDASSKLVAQLAIGRNAGLLAYDPVAKIAYVADREGDRIAVVTVGTELALARSFATPAEPYAVALTPDRRTLLVVTIADRTLVALDVATGAPRWRAPLAREPRGLAISPDGARALVTYLTTGAVEEIDLRAGRGGAHIALAAPASLRSERVARPLDDDDDDDEPPASRRVTQPRAHAHARAAFAVAFLGADRAVVPYQRETPVQATARAVRTSSYGGGVEAPVSHRLAVIGFDQPVPAQASLQIVQHQPRALAYDGAHDALYVAGLGSDTILQLRNASTAAIDQGATLEVRSTTARCGPDGLAITPAGDLLVWCAFTRSVSRFARHDKHLVVPSMTTAGSPAVPSRRSPAEHDGMVMFHAADARVSQRGSMACATCHPDGRTDGLSWRIDSHTLQTPILAGRLVNTQPYKWDGSDKDLAASISGTMQRLGGTGLSASQTAALTAYLSTMPSVRAPTRDAALVARGRQVFEAAGCRTCHDGATYTDRSTHRFRSDLADADTPSLRGLAASAPYFHDGSAPTLEAVLRGSGAVHGMADTSKLTPAQLADLVGFLETL